MMIYLSSSVRQWRLNPHSFGVMLNIVRPIGGQQEALAGGAKWIIDNGNFTGKFDLAKWLKMLDDLLPYRATCLGIPLPDAVADYEKTLVMFRQYLPYVAERQYPVALVSQDGLIASDVPWDLIRTLFIGGTNNHKRGREAAGLITEAKRRGKWVHIGRVNSGSALLENWPQADSCDGTTFSHHPTQQLKSILYGIENSRQWPYQERWV